MSAPLPHLRDDDPAPFLLSLSLTEVELLLLGLDLHGEYVVRAFDQELVAQLTRRLTWLRDEYNKQQEKRGNRL